MVHYFWLAHINQSLLEKMLDCLRATGNSVESLMRVPSGGPSYVVNGSGIVAVVDYDVGNQRALVTIQSKPFLVPASMIEQKVREALKMARG